MKNQEKKSIQEEEMGDSFLEEIPTSSYPSNNLEATKENTYIPPVSLELLKRTCCDKLKHLSPAKPDDQSSKMAAHTCNSSSQELSTQGIVKLASTRLLQYYKCQESGVCFDRYQLIEDVELALLLQASAQMVANQELDRATTLLRCCDLLALPNGNPLQRVVYYFVGALRERIERISQPEKFGENLQRTPMDMEEAIMRIYPEIIARQQDKPFTQVSYIVGVQAILDSVASAKKIHLIDFGIKSGSHWAIMMQALLERRDCPLELLKITAVGTSKQRIKEAGNWLSSFAEEMKLPFSFEPVISHMKDLKRDSIVIEPDQVVAVFFELRLWSMLVRPRELEALIRVIKNLKPCVMIISEIEANTNLTDFMERFKETLSLCSVITDYVQDSTDGNQRCRDIAEGVYLKDMIQNIVATEGEERIYRHAKLDFWREFFAGFGILEKELSESLLYQARLWLNSSARWSSCTLEMNGKSLIMGWKGTQLHSVSAWKFLDV